jgi:hypothetical protein
MRNNSTYFYKQIIPEPCINSLDRKFKNQKVALYFRSGNYVLFKKFFCFLALILTSSWQD